MCIRSYHARNSFCVNRLRSLEQHIARGGFLAGFSFYYCMLKWLSPPHGHGRLGRLAFHPFGRHLATASFDQTWRLWDVQTGECLQEQARSADQACRPSIVCLWVCNQQKRTNFLDVYQPSDEQHIRTTESSRGHDM